MSGEGVRGAGHICGLLLTSCGRPAAEKMGIFWPRAILRNEPQGVHTPTHRETERQTQTQTQTQTHTQRQTDTNTDTHKRAHTHTMPHITYILVMMSVNFAAVCADADHYKDMEAISARITGPIRA